MTISLGGHVFEPGWFSVTEQHEELGGQDARVITIAGMVDGLASESAVQAALDAVLAAASETALMPLSLRAGRRLWVRRTGFTRMLAPDGLGAAYTLHLAAENPFEEAADETVVSWSVSNSGAAIFLDTGGNAEAPLRIELVAQGAVVAPSFSDGLRNMVYHGTVASGQRLVLDGVSGLALLEGVDVTPYTGGAFPRVGAGGAWLSYADDAASSHGAAVTVSHRARWW